MLCAGYSVPTALHIPQILHILRYRNKHTSNVLASCIAAGVGIAFSRVCLSVCLRVRALTWKQLELLTPNLVHVYSIAVARHALTQRSKGYTVTKTVTVTRLLVTRAAAATAVCCCCRRVQDGRAHGSAIPSTYPPDLLQTTCFY